MKVKPERSSTDPYNKVGQKILDWCAERGWTYKYACQFKE